MTKNFYISGIDKASNNIAIICIRHIRIMALDRLQGEDFAPKSRTMAEVLFSIEKDLDTLLPEIRLKYSGLPYLFASFKLHKLKYRWITSATKCALRGLPAW